MFPASLLYVLLVLLVAGVLLWALGQFPLDETIRKLIRVVVIVVIALWIIYLLFGLAGGITAPMAPLRR